MHISLEAPLCCEVGDEVVEVTFHEAIMNYCYEYRNYAFCWV